jgi:hypothetical protein
MKKALIASLVAFVLVSTAGIAMAGNSEITVDSYVRLGSTQEQTIVQPAYLNGELTYATSFNIGLGSNVMTHTNIIVPDGAEGGDTEFEQDIQVNEVISPVAVYGDALVVIGVDGDDDDAIHTLDTGFVSIGDPYPYMGPFFGPAIPTVSADVQIHTDWSTDADTHLEMNQQIWSDTIWEARPDAGVVGFSTLDTYGEPGHVDYVYQLNIPIGAGVYYDLDWDIGD